MTVWDLMAASRRRWPVVLIGVLLSAATLYMIDREPGVYWAQSDLVFLAPTSSRFPNSLSTGSASLIMTAGLVGHDVDQSATFEATSSASITLVNEGVRDGTSIRLPSIGGQWATNFSEPVLDVQAVARTPDEVRQRMVGLQRSVEVALNRRQDAARVAAINRISIQPSPTTVEVKYSGGDHVRAGAVAALLGIALTLGAVVVADSERLRRRWVQVREGRSTRRAPDAGPGVPSSASRRTSLQQSTDPTTANTAGRGSALV